MRAAHHSYQLTGVLMFLVMAFVGAAAAQKAAPAKQDPKLLRFVERATSWYPDSTFRIVQEVREQTPSGSYRIVAVERKCANKYLTGTTTWVVDEVARTVWVGSIGLLPPASARTNDLAGFLKRFLPGALQKSLRMSVTVVWNRAGLPSGALIPFLLKVDSGYGSYFKSAAVTADGRRVVLGVSLPLDQDPVAYRRKLLHSSKLVMWDHPGEKAKVEIVEFSDFECPACKAKWPIITKILSKFDGVVRHGMVNFPLTTIHPWSFRAAAAAWCVVQQAPSKLIPLKEQFYSMQRDMTVSEVGPVAGDFVASHGLDGRLFNACFLEEPSLNAVNRQMALAEDLGVMATPTYFVNGWQVQVPSEDWLLPLIQRLAAGREP